MGRGILGQAELRALLKSFKEQNAEKYHLSALGYFGSYARDEANEDSDIDIVFNTDSPNLFKAATMKHDLEILLERPVDIVRLRENMNPRLKQRIIREARYV